MTQMMIRVESKNSARSAKQTRLKTQMAWKDLFRRAHLKLWGDARIECPVDTGFLRESHDLLGGYPVAAVVARATYAGHVHDGTRYIRPNPWMTRARNQLVRWLRTQKVRVS